MQLKINVVATETDELGNIVRVVEGHNSIADGDTDVAGTENGYIFMLLKLFDPAPQSYAAHYDSTDYVTTMEIGTGTASDTGLQTPVPASTQESISITLDKTTLTAPVMTLTVTWGNTYPALSGITEAVLLNDSDECFAYKNFSTALSKTAAGSLKIDWTITASA